MRYLLLLALLAVSCGHRDTTLTEGSYIKDFCTARYLCSRDIVQSNGKIITIWDELYIDEKEQPDGTWKVCTGTFFNANRRSCLQSSILGQDGERSCITDLPTIEEIEKVYNCK